MYFFIIISNHAKEIASTNEEVPSLLAKFRHSHMCFDM